MEVERRLQERRHAPEQSVERASDEAHLTARPTKSSLRPSRPLWLLRPPKLTAPARWLTAPATTLLIALVQRALLPEPEIAPFVLFFLGVALASWLAGRWAGVATAVLSAATANYFFVPPYNAWTLSGPALTATLMFLFGATATALLAGSLRDAMQLAEHAAADLRKSEEALAERDRFKNEFLATLSHELRNPLAPIRNSLYILERAASGGEQAKSARAVMARQVDHLGRLVDDLLDITRISRGKIQLHVKPVELIELVRTTVEDHLSLFVDNEIDLSVECAAPEAWVHGDVTRLAQAVGNLLSNSAKFTPRGGHVRVGVKSVGAERVAIQVSDTGPGIEPNMLPRLFEPFTQADTTLDRSKGGLGLGLALVKGLVEAQGGTVAAHSEGPGKGAELTIELPLLRQPPTASPPAATALAAREGRRVLVIEDNVDAADSLRIVLELGGHDVEVAYGGREGIELARSFRPHVVLCDIGLPRMDGYEVARAMRAEPTLSASKLVALTGYAGPEDVARSQEAGFDQHLPKPPSMTELARILEEAPRTGQAERA